MENLTEKKELKKNETRTLKNNVGGQTSDLNNKIDFVSLKDLNNEIITKEFYFLPVRMQKKESRNGFKRVFINVEIDKNFLNISLTETKNFKIVPLSEDRFNDIFLSLNLPINDQLGKPITEWVFKAPCRFVKGNYDNGEEYYSLEIVFKRYLYNVYFFTPTQKKIINSLIEKKQFPYNFLDRPDKITALSNDEELTIDF